MTMTRCFTADSLSDDFRNAMAAVCTPVSVITTLVDGVPWGTTVSAFASLSMEPPMVLAALDRTSDLLASVRRTSMFAVNVMEGSQHRLAAGFARKGGTAKFAGVDWRIDDGMPRLAGTAGFVSCDVQSFIDGGDHVVLLGAVRAASVEPGRPLTYYARGFGTHAAHDPQMG